MFQLHDRFFWTNDAQKVRFLSIIRLARSLDGELEDEEKKQLFQIFGSIFRNYANFFIAFTPKKQS